VVEVEQGGASKEGKKMDSKLQAIQDAIVEDYKEALKDSLISIILYGSAVTGEYVSGTSDINLMIVTSDDSLKILDRVIPLVKRFRKKGVSTPLFVTPTYIEQSLDVFPLEYLSIRSNYRILYGRDVLKEIHIEKEYLRLQCERELKRRLLLLKEAYLEGERKDRFLSAVIKASVEGLVSIFRAIIFLYDMDQPQTKRQTVENACSLLEMDSTLFRHLIEIKGVKKGKIKDIKAIYTDYLNALRSLSKRIDALEVGI